MLVTQQPVMRRFWYPVIPMDQLRDGPKPFRLLNQDLVLWLDSQGKPQAAEDAWERTVAWFTRHLA